MCTEKGKKRLKCNLLPLSEERGQPSSSQSASLEPEDPLSHLFPGHPFWKGSVDQWVHESMAAQSQSTAAGVEQYTASLPSSSSYGALHGSASRRQPSVGSCCRGSTGPSLATPRWQQCTLWVGRPFTRLYSFAFCLYTQASSRKGPEVSYNRHQQWLHKINPEKSETKEKKMPICSS